MTTSERATPHPAASQPASPAALAEQARLQALYALAQPRVAGEPSAALREAGALAAGALGAAHGAVLRRDGAALPDDLDGSELPAAVAAAAHEHAGDALDGDVADFVDGDGCCWALASFVRGGVDYLLLVGPFAAGEAIDRAFLAACADLLRDGVHEPPATMLMPAAIDRASVDTLLESMSDPVALYDAAGRVRSGNAAYHALLAAAGLSDGPLVAAPEIVLPRDRLGRRLRPGDSVLSRALAGRSSQAQRVFRMADGHDRHFEITGNPLRDPGGAIVGAVTVWRDTSDAVAREQALRLMDEVRRGVSHAGELRHAARAVCRRVVSHLPWVNMAAVFAEEGDALVFLAHAGFPSRAAALLSATPLGPALRATQALLGDRPTIFDTERDRPGNEAARRVVAASGAATFVNLPLAAGARRFGLLTLAGKERHVPNRDELALLEALAAQIGADLDGVQKREQAETERSRLQAVLDQLPEGVLLFDAAARLEMSNRSAEQILGRSVDPEMPLVSFGAHYGFLQADGRLYQPGDEPIVRTFSTGRPVLGEEQIVRHADGKELPIVSNVAPIRDAGGQLAAVIMVFQDITSLREMDRLRDEFLSIAGHELRTPITSIRGLAQLLERRYAQLEPEHIAAALAGITEQTAQMALLVDDLLDVSRIRSGRLSLTMQPCDLSVLLRGAVALLAPQREGEIRLHLPESLQTNGDGARLQQVFNNLLDNAAKYSDARAPIDVTLLRHDGWATVAVRDRGIGIPAEAQQHLFERFYRAENAAQYAGGLGLGLYICREIVERHGGTIAVASTPGDGSLFTVRLPIAGADAAGG
ncbi:MAG TPA: ATP-binding protein [Dehalococcoidia bacterium]|nr:ATP-binding protein [Dehalococcoidia bacterium]